MTNKKRAHQPYIIKTNILHPAAIPSFVYRQDGYELSYLIISNYSIPVVRISTLKI